METIELKSWSDFSAAIERIRVEHGTYFDEIAETERQNRVLFRGQSDSSWDLKTTLDRVQPHIPIAIYYRFVERIYDELQSVTGKQWTFESFVDRQIDPKVPVPPTFIKLPSYELLVYLRHHGFPSPLLDWTSSPYIAAFFAMEESRKADQSAVFAYIGNPGGEKIENLSGVRIHTMGPHVTTDRRHFAQKASYTFATQWESDLEYTRFAMHEDVQKVHDFEQDILIKVTIPRADRTKSLRELEDYNINHYTLFYSDDALVRSLAVRAFELET